MITVIIICIFLCYKHRATIIIKMHIIIIIICMYAGIM